MPTGGASSGLIVVERGQCGCDKMWHVPKPPETKYASADGLSIAYQVSGAGPIDVVLVPGLVSHLEISREMPGPAHAFERYESFARLIRFDKRGTGLSDRVTGSPTLEERMDDVRAVMDAAGSERAALVGFSEGGPMSILFAASHPERTTALVLEDSFARLAWAPDYPWGMTTQTSDGLREVIHGSWGDGTFISLFFPSAKGDEAANHRFRRLERYSATPGAVADIAEMILEIDIRSVLPTLKVPTLVIHRSGDPIIPPEHGRYLAQHVPGSRLVEIESVDHMAVQASEGDTHLDEIEEFLTGVRHGPTLDRVLATVLFTDIVGSTERAAQLGDRKWRETLQAHHDITRRELERFRGNEVKTTGDGFLATFDGPARAIRCGCAIRDGIRSWGLEVRAGLHTGEIEAIGNDVGGIGVHIAQRVQSHADPGEVLVSRTVTDLVAGSGIDFRDRGEHELKGVPGSWRLFAVDT
jgi:class 3 adenylate cyclase